MDLAKTLGSIIEDPPMPQYPTPEERQLPRRYYTYVNTADQAHRQRYDLTDIIEAVRRRAIASLQRHIQAILGFVLSSRVSEWGNIQVVWGLLRRNPVPMAIGAAFPAVNRTPMAIGVSYTVSQDAAIAIGTRLCGENPAPMAMGAGFGDLRLEPVVIRTAFLEGCQLQWPLGQDY